MALDLPLGKGLQRLMLSLLTFHMAFVGGWDPNLGALHFFFFLQDYNFSLLKTDVFGRH